MIEEIGITVLAGTILTSLGWMINSRILERPKIRVKYSPRGGSSGAHSAEALEVKWGYYLTFTNLTKHDALDIKVISTSCEDVITALPFPCLQGTEEKCLSLNLKRVLPKSDVTSVRHDFHGVLLPKEIQKFELILEYSNQREAHFYTIFCKNGDDQENTYHLSRPMTAP